MQGYDCSCDFDSGCKAGEGLTLPMGQLCRLLTVDDPEPAVEEIELTEPESSEPRAVAVCSHEGILVVLDENGDLWASSGSVRYTTECDMNVRMKRIKLKRQE